MASGGYRLRYTVSVDYIPAGAGPVIGTQNGPGAAPSGNAQTLTFFNQASNVNSQTFTSSDVTNLLTNMTTDLSTQMNAALTRVQNFATGSN